MIGDSERDVEAGKNAGCRDSLVVTVNKENCLKVVIEEILS